MESNFKLKTCITPTHITMYLTSITEFEREASCFKAQYEEHAVLAIAS